MTDDVIERAKHIVALDEQKVWFGFGETVDLARALLAATERAEKAEAREAVLRAALQEAATQFRFYEQEHRKKLTPDGFFNAETNAGIASRLELVLANASPAAEALLKIVEQVRSDSIAGFALSDDLRNTLQAYDAASWGSTSHDR